GRRGAERQLPEPAAVADHRGGGHPPGLPRRAGAHGREAHRPARARLLLDRLPPGAVEAGRGHRPARALRRADLRHPAAHRPDPHAGRSCVEGCGGRGPAGNRLMAKTPHNEDAETPQAQMGRLILALRTQGVTDAAVLSAIETTPREMFTPEL